MFQLYYNQLICEEFFWLEQLPTDFIDYCPGGLKAKKDVRVSSAPLGYQIIHNRCSESFLHVSGKPFIDSVIRLVFAVGVVNAS